jgi:hypothetical protein
MNDFADDLMKIGLVMGLGGLFMLVFVGIPILIFTGVSWVLAPFAIIAALGLFLEAFACVADIW